MMQRHRIKAEFDWQELNYLDSALRSSIAEQQKWYEESEGAGNSKYLLWYTKRLLGKIRRITREGRNKWMTATQKKQVAKFMRAARKRYKDKQ